MIRVRVQPRPPFLPRNVICLTFGLPRRNFQAVSATDTQASAGISHMSLAASFSIRLLSTLTLTASVISGSRSPEIQVVIIRSGHREAFAAKNHLKE